MPASIDPATAAPCGCTADVPCLEHVAAVSERLLNSPAALAADLASIPSDVDMAGPEQDERDAARAKLRAQARADIDTWRNSKVTIFSREGWRPASEAECVVDHPQLSRAQRRVVKQLLWEIFQHGSYNPTDYEFKTVEVTLHTSERRPTVWLYTVMGRVGDDGTYGVLTRCSRHISIGWLRGGCTLHNRARFDKHKREKVRAANARGFWTCAYSTTL